MILAWAIAAGAALASTPDSARVGGPGFSEESVTSVTRNPVEDACNVCPATAAAIRELRDRVATRSVVEARSFGSATAPLGEVDPWRGPDKVKHFFTAAFVQGSVYGSLRATNLGHRSSVLGASLGTTAVGLLKELRDRRAGGLFSVRDLVWNTAGAAAVTVLLERTRR